MIVDVDTYQYEPYHDPIDAYHGIPKPETISFYTALETAEYLSKNYDFVSALQNVIPTKFHECPNYKALEKSRSRLNTIPSFRFYRKKNRTFNDQVQMLQQRQTSIPVFNQHILNLSTEINSSRTTVAKGQKVFYGLSEGQFNAWKKIGFLPHFLSTSLSLTVAAEHSIRKTPMDSSGNTMCSNVVLILSLHDDQKAIFAPKGQPCEYELLFDRNATIKINAEIKPPNGLFTIVTADLVGFY